MPGRIEEENISEGPYRQPLDPLKNSGLNNRAYARDRAGILSACMNSFRPFRTYWLLEQCTQHGTLKNVRTDKPSCGSRWILRTSSGLGLSCGGCVNDAISRLGLRDSRPVVWHGVDSQYWILVARMFAAKMPAVDHRGVYVMENLNAYKSKNRWSPGSINAAYLWLL